MRFQIAVSLDGYVAGPHQSRQEPLGVGGLQLHEWSHPLAAWRKPHGLEGGLVNASTQVVEESQHVGAVIMGRHMFGGGHGPWGEEPWEGWWGENPPFGMPVFVLTHHAREPLPKQGGTTFHFVTDGIESALRRARESAGGKNVAIMGGARTIQQYLAAGLVDEFELSLVPVLLGDGERLLENVGEPRLEQVRVIEAPGVTHVKYRVAK